MNNNEAKFSGLLGETLISVVKNEDNTEIVFTLENGDRLVQRHDQDCCERVEIIDICGDFADLLNSPVTLAEESTNTHDGPRDSECDDSYTWTFYRLATVKGYVTIRWYGSSNGYYSERVTCYWEEPVLPRL